MFYAIWKKTGSLRLSRGGVGATFLFLCGLMIFAAFFVQDVTLAVALLTTGAFCAAMAGPCAFSNCRTRTNGRCANNSGHTISPVNRRPGG